MAMFFLVAFIAFMILGFMFKLGHGFRNFIARFRRKRERIKTKWLSASTTCFLLALASLVVFLLRILRI